MKLDHNLGHLTYCLNIHATQSWDEIKTALLGPVAAVKARLSPDAPFAIGLRFSAEALDELADPTKRALLGDILRRNDFLAITVNGFPYGKFHGTRVKEQVYQPDWRNVERLRYTNALADLMAEIAPPGHMISLSTVPGTFKPLARGAEAEMARNYLACVAHLIALEARTGVQVALAIEPEPFCFLETIAESVDFFRDYLFCDQAAAHVADLAGLPMAQAAEKLPRHLGLCYDVCHAAVAYEDAKASIAALRQAGIPIHKLQLSAALRIAKIGPAERNALRAFDEPTYLHQVHRRGAMGQVMHQDLSEALALGRATDDEEWRVHFHVPVFIDDLGVFVSTQDFLKDILALHLAEPISAHLEIETYTWDVLPDHLRGRLVDHDIAREFSWVLGRLGQ